MGLTPFQKLVGDTAKHQVDFGEERLKHLRRLKEKVAKADQKDVETHRKRVRESHLQQKIKAKKQKKRREQGNDDEDQEGATEVQLGRESESEGGDMSEDQSSEEENPTK